MVWSTNADDAKMLLGIPFPMNYVIIYHLTLNLVDIGIDNKLKILWKSLLCFVNIEKIDYSKIAKIWLVKFCLFNFKTSLSSAEAQIFLRVITSQTCDLLENGNAEGRHASKPKPSKP